MASKITTKMDNDSKKRGNYQDNVKWHGYYYYYRNVSTRGAYVHQSR